MYRKVTKTLTHVSKHEIIQCIGIILAQAEWLMTAVAQQFGRPPMT